MEVMQAWWAPNSGILERIEALHKQYPDGFFTIKEEAKPVAPAIAPPAPAPVPPPPMPPPLPLDSLHLDDLQHKDKAESQDSVASGSTEASNKRGWNEDEAQLPRDKGPPAPISTPPPPVSTPPQLIMT